jgi:hypothetical protein
LLTAVLLRSLNAEKVGAYLNKDLEILALLLRLKVQLKKRTSLEY